MTYRYRDTDGHDIEATPETDLDGQQVVTLWARGEYARVPVRIPVDRIEELVAGLRDTARQAAPRYCGNVYEDYKRRTTIYQERKAELDAFYDRFDLEQVDGGERWRCKTCGAHGETWQPMLGAYDYPHAIGTAAHRHPTCERTSQ